MLLLCFAFNTIPRNIVQAINTGNNSFVDLKSNSIDNSYESIIESLNSIIHPLNSSPLELSDADLEPLSYLGDSKIVGLGEATHGTKEFFQMKHRIFKYLVEKHGFKVFAFECDMGESYYVDKFVTEGKGDIDYIMKNIMHFWTWRTEEVKDLLLWMKEYNEDKSEQDKIHFIGVDCQFMTYQSDIILNYFDETNVPLSYDSVKFLNEIRKLKIENHIDFIKSKLYYRFMTQNKKIKFDQNVDLLLAEIEDKKDELIDASSEFEYLFIKQIALNIKQVHDFKYNVLRWRYSGTNYRDLYMAENTLWTSDLFGEDTKVALWAHNMHVSNYESFGTTGSHLKEELNDEYQIVGFSFSLGSFVARDMLRPLAKPITHQIKQEPKLGSINYVFHHAKYDNFILREIDIQEDSDFDNYISQPQFFFTAGSGFNIFQYKLGRYYYPIDLKEMFDVLINWDTTKAAEQLN